MSGIISIPEHFETINALEKAWQTKYKHLEERLWIHLETIDALEKAWKAKYRHLEERLWISETARIEAENQIIQDDVAATRRLHQHVLDDLHFRLCSLRVDRDEAIEVIKKYQTADFTGWFHNEDCRRRTECDECDKQAECAEHGVLDGTEDNCPDCECGITDLIKAQRVALAFLKKHGIKP